jgi:uncharacterized protein with ParB-like and HNH nuclease domain
MSSKLIVDQKNVKYLFQDKKATFLIPDYQRPYAWGEDECKVLWEDLFSFSFPNNNCDSFDSSESYFLGPIVTFRNDEGKLEIIDGQQRLTTLLLLLRAFYNRLEHMKDNRSIKMREDIEKCIWRANEFGEYDPNDLKINSEVATDNDKEEFMDILRKGTSEGKSRYATNFRYFQDKIGKFIEEYPSFFALYPARILNNCVLLPIEAESQDTALRIFSTLNDRGKPLSDSDIFKAQLYKFYSSIGKKEEFITTWKELDELVTKIFHPYRGTPLDELFTRYMYYERALLTNRSSMTEGLRKFYEKNGYVLLRREQTLENLVLLADFWKDVYSQNEDRFSVDVLKRLFVLNYAPNSLWTYIVSVYFMHYKNAENMLDNEKFYMFLNRLTGFTWAYAISNPGITALRAPVFNEMVNIIENKEIAFENYLFQEELFRSQFTNFSFSNTRAITKSMIVWWAFSFDSQELLPLDATYDIEHIFPRNRQVKEGGLSNDEVLEMLGNKSVLERRVNIRASDYRFADKIKYYNGEFKSTGERIGTKIHELRMLSQTLTDFTETDIRERTSRMLDKFIAYLKSNSLISNRQNL